MPDEKQLRDWVARRAAPPAPSVADADFKNFHRLLCERFGYEHDEEHWKRDQLSLIEHLAWGRCITTPSQEEKRSESIDCGECACLPGFCDKEGEVRSVLRMIVEKINAEGPASRDWQGFTHLCELAEQLLAAPSVADAKCMCSGLGPCEKLSNCRKAPSVADAAGASDDARDAARWRHLRNCGVIVDFTHAGPWKFTDDADAAVDKLIARSAAIKAASASKTTERKKLCTGSHIMCEGREYCLGHPSCSELAAKESGND